MPTSLTARSDTVSLDAAKVRKHEVEPAGLELKLQRDSFYGHMTLELHLRGYDVAVVLEKFDGEKDFIETEDKETGKCTARYYMLKEAERKKAEARYREILEKLRKGEYTLHLYSNGKFEVEFTSG